MRWILPLLLLACGAAQALTLDTTSTSTTNGYSHGGAAGADCAVVHLLAADAAVSAMAYGATGMTEFTNSPRTPSYADGIPVRSFWASAISGGSQTVTATGPTQVALVTITYTSTTGACDEQATQAYDSGATVVNPSFSLALSAVTSAVSMVWSSGRPDASTGVTQLSGWSLGAEYPIAAPASSVGAYTYDTIGSTDVTCGATQTSDEFSALCVAIAETAGGPPPSSSQVLTLQEPNKGYGPHRSQQLGGLLQ